MSIFRTREFLKYSPDEVDLVKKLIFFKRQKQKKWFFTIGLYFFGGLNFFER
jgi:hypothetical protein